MILMIEFSIKGFLATLLFLCPLVGAGSFYFVSDERRPFNLIVPIVSLVFFLILLGIFLFLSPFQWPLHSECSKEFPFVFSGVIGRHAVKVVSIFTSVSVLCGLFHWIVLGQKISDVKKYVAYLGLLLFFFLMLATAQSFFSFLLSLGGVSVMGYLINTFMHEDSHVNRASFTHQILEFFTLFACMVWGFSPLGKLDFGGVIDIYYCVPIFFLILQKVNVVGFNFWRKEKSSVSDFYFIFQKNFFFLVPIIIYTSPYLLRFPQPLKLGFMALGVFHLISACGYIFEGVGLRGVTESLYRFLGATSLICIACTSRIENIVSFLLFASYVLALLFLANSAIESFFFREDINQALSRKTIFVFFSFALSLLAFVGGLLFFFATCFDRANIIVQSVYIFIFSFFSTVFFLRWGALIREISWKKFWMLKGKEALYLVCLGLGVIVLLLLLFEVGTFFQQKQFHNLYFLGYFCAFSLAPFCLGLFMKNDLLYRIFHNAFFVTAIQKAEDSFSAAYEYIFIVPFKIVSEFFSRRVDVFLFEENFFNGTVGFLSSVSKIMTPNFKRVFSYQMLSIFLIIAFLAFVSQVL